jgi:hypothetical protein
MVLLANSLAALDVIVRDNTETGFGYEGANVCDAWCSGGFGKHTNTNTTLYQVGEK